MFGALIALTVLLIIAGGALGFTLAALEREQRKNRAMVRDQHIAELEREMDMHLPALASIRPEVSPLAYVLGIMAGLWIRERASRGRRW